LGTLNKEIFDQKVAIYLAFDNNLPISFGSALDAKYET